MKRACSRRGSVLPGLGYSSSLSPGLRNSLLDCSSSGACFDIGPNSTQVIINASSTCRIDLKWSEGYHTSPYLQEQKKGFNFDDSKSAFAPLSTADLGRALAVFKLCSIQPLVKNSSALLKTSDRIMGKGFTKWALKQSFFGHFCAGETAEELLPVVDKLRHNGIGSILDYAAESDVPQQKPQQQPAQQQTKDERFLKERREGVVSARVYFYDNETACDNNAKIFMHCIEDAGKRAEGFAAVKVTALGNPELLMRISQILVASRKLFREFAANDSGGAPSPADGQQPFIGSSRITKANFIKALEMLKVSMSQQEISQLFSKMDTDNNGYIDYIEWLESLQPNEPDLRPFFTSSKNPEEKSLLPTLNEDEIFQMDSMVRRLDVLAQEAAKKKVRLMVDAEHTYFQPAIDHMVLNLQYKYNREFPSIYNTYQCYLLDTYSRVKVDLERARRKDYWFAAKLVRGAYMVQERKRAKEMNYQDPIQPNIQETHKNYHGVLDMVLKDIKKANVMVASHNETTVRFAIDKMAEYGINSKGGGVYFGQLLGMCDHVSLTLGANNYSVYKYVPYGPVREVVPYLIRRAEENSDVLGGVTKERAMLWQEFKRRVHPLA